jgi:hypothetical protein
VRRCYAVTSPSAQQQRIAASPRTFQMSPVRMYVCTYMCVCVTLYHFACYCFQLICPIETPNIPCSKCNSSSPSPTALQRIRPSSWPCIIFHNKMRFYGEMFLASSSKSKNWRNTRCPLSANALLIYSQLPTTSGGHLHHM